MQSKKILILEKYREQEPEILKQNNLINCSFEELSAWNETHHDLLNELIAIFQQANKRCSENLFEYEFNHKIFFRRKTLEKNTKLKRRTNKEIYEFFKKIRDTSFTIKNIYQKNGYKTTATIGFLNKVLMHENIGKDTYFELEYTELFALLCNKNYSLRFGNYSKINLLQTTKLQSKYAKALLEMLEANRYKKEFILKENELKNYLKYYVKDYRFSYLVRVINHCFNQVNNIIKFSYIPNKQNKSITFKLYR